MITMVPDWSGAFTIFLTADSDLAYELQLNANSNGNACILNFSTSRGFVAVVDIFVLTGTGGFTLASPSILWASNTAPVVTATASKTDWFRIYCGLPAFPDGAGGERPVGQIMSQGT
jgi:hypothetical protein